MVGAQPNGAQTKNIWRIQLYQAYKNLNDSKSSTQEFEELFLITV